MKRDKKMWFTMAMISGLGLMGSFNLAVNSIMQLLIDKYPEVPVVWVRSVSTLPSTVQLVGSLLFSVFLTKRTKIKPRMILAALFILSGGIPYFFPDSFAVLFITSFTSAVGISLCLLRTACVNKAVNYDVKQFALWIGFIQAVETAAPIVLTPIAGFLGDLDIKYSFTLYFLAVIPLICYVFFFKEPEIDEEQIRQEELENGKTTLLQRIKVNPRVVFYVIQVGFVTLVSFSLFTAMATFIDARGLGGAGVSGTVISIYKLGTFLGSLLFGFLDKKFDRYGDTLAFALFAVGFGIIIASHTLPLVLIGAVMCGIAFIWNYLLCIKWSGQVSSDETRAFAVTLQTASAQIGIIFSTYYIALTDKIASALTFLKSDAERSFMVSTIIFVILFVLSLIIDPRPKKIVQQSEETEKE